jgi:hypothetical protein
LIIFKLWIFSNFILWTRFSKLTWFKINMMCSNCACCHVGICLNVSYLFVTTNIDHLFFGNYRFLVKLIFAIENFQSSNIFVIELGDQKFQLLTLSCHSEQLKKKLVTKSSDLDFFQSLFIKFGWCSKVNLLGQININP